MRRAALLGFGIAGLGVLAGCGAQGVVSPTPVTVIGSLPKAAPAPLTPAFKLKGDPAAGAKVFLQGQAHDAADRRRRRVRGDVDRRHPVELPPTFPAGIAAFACDLDRTLVAEDALLRPRTAAAIAATRATGVHVIVVTGRMFRSVRPYVLEAGLDDPVICYQGAVVADPRSGEFLRHVPIPRAVAIEAIDAVVARGFHVNCYVDDLLYVADVTPEARAYADFQGLEIIAVGPLRDWLHADPTKLVAVGDPRALDELEAERRRSPAATARTTASSSTGPASASPSRTPTPTSSRAPTSSSRRSTTKESPPCSRHT